MRQQLLLLLSGFFLFSCGQQSSNEEIILQLRNLDNKVSGLQATVSNLEQRIEALEPEQKLSGIPNKKQTGKKKKTSTASYSAYAEPEQSYASKKSYSSSSGRCQAMTKKGTQCKRSASGGGTCWQH